jgi:hypothetical protein
MKIEENMNFNQALDIDINVWKVMPKIQARKLKTLAGVPDGLKGLYECYTSKITWEGYQFTTQWFDTGFDILITHCPWIEIMKKSNRGHLAQTIGPAICGAECPVWASEFGQNIVFEMKEQLCTGCSQCRFRFHE